MVKIFISYRRKSSAFTLLLANKLSEHLDADIFVDFDSIDQSDFESSILSHLRASDVFLLMVTEHTFADRIHNDSDWVRKEIKISLEKDIPIVLVSENGLYPPRDLPEDIRDVANKQGIEFYPAYFDAAVLRLVKFLAKATNVQLKSNPVQATTTIENMPVPRKHVEELAVEQSEVSDSNAKQILADALAAYDTNDYAQALFLFEALKDIDYQSRAINIDEIMIQVQEAYERAERKRRASFDYDEIALFANNEKTLPQALKTFKDWAEANTEFVDELDTENLRSKKITAPSSWRWIAIIAVIMIVLLFNFGWMFELFSGNDKDSGNGILEPSATTEIEQSGNDAQIANTNISEDDARATDAAEAWATLTALAPTNTPTITTSPTSTPPSPSDIQLTGMAEAFAEATVSAQVETSEAQFTQSAVSREQSIAGSTATYIAVLSLTPTPTITPTVNPYQGAIANYHLGRFDEVINELSNNLESIDSSLYFYLARSGFETGHAEADDWLEQGYLRIGSDLIEDCYAIVSSSFPAKVRLGPSSQANPPIAWIEYGTQIQVQYSLAGNNDTPDWNFVRVDGEFGWVRGDLLVYEDGCTNRYPIPVEGSFVRGWDPDGTIYNTGRNVDIEYSGSKGNIIYSGPNGGIVLDVKLCTNCGSQGVSTSERGLQLYDPTVYDDEDWNFGLGHYIVVLYENTDLPDTTSQYLANNDMSNWDVYCIYSHLQDILVEQDDNLSPNQQIATLGNSGASNGAHLSIECRASEAPEGNYISEGVLFDPDYLYRFASLGISSEN